MANKHQQADDTTNPPAIVRNYGTLSTNDFNEALAIGYTDLRAQSRSSSELFGTATLLRGDDRQRLVDAPFVLICWNFNEGSYTDEFVSATLLTGENYRYVINDSSSGIYRQLRAVTWNLGRQYGPIDCPNGLTYSDYWIDQSGQTYTNKPTDVSVTPARTYYLS